MNMLKRSIYYNPASNKVSSQSLDMFHESHGSLFLVCLGFFFGWLGFCLGISFGWLIGFFLCYFWGFFNVGPRDHLKIILF